MKKDDHRQLASFWMEHAGDHLPRIYKWAFVFGNYEPDINYLTYLHGFLKRQKFRGHHYQNVMPVLLRLIDKNIGRPLSPLQCYRIGKCCHYAADIFTYPHNNEFAGSIKDHVRYEMQLHEYWSHVFDRYVPEVSPLPAAATAASVKKSIIRMHRAYISERPGQEHDCKYILTVTQLLIEACLLQTNAWTEQLLDMEIALAQSQSELCTFVLENRIAHMLTYLSMSYHL